MSWLSLVLLLEIPSVDVGWVLQIQACVCAAFLMGWVHEFKEVYGISGKSTGECLMGRRRWKIYSQSCCWIFLSILKTLDLTVPLYHWLLGRVKFDHYQILAGSTFPVVIDFCFFQSVPNLVLKLNLRFCVYSHFYFSVHICLLHSTIRG